MPTTNKRPLKVFLCHAHADRAPVRALYARLTKVSNGLYHGLADESGLLNLRMYNRHKQTQVRFNP